MQKYGINNVRGGSFCEIKLNKDNLTTIKNLEYCVLAPIRFLLIGKLYSSFNSCKLKLPHIVKGLVMREL